jgi:hypothetical protein
VDGVYQSFYLEDYKQNTTFQKHDHEQNFTWPIFLTNSFFSRVGYLSPRANLPNRNTPDTPYLFTANTYAQPYGAFHGHSLD